MLRQESLDNQGVGAAGRQSPREVIFPQLDELADMSRAHETGVRKASEIVIIGSTKM